MCYTCWEIDGKPRIINEKTIDASNAIIDIQENHILSSELDAVIYDMNLEDSDIKKAIDKVSGAEYNILEKLISLTYNERVSAIAISEGWVK